MALEVLGVMTTQAKVRLARMLESGKSFKIANFAIGDNGTTTDVTIAKTPDPNITGYDYGNVLSPADLPLPSGKVITSVSFLNAGTCPVFECDFTGVEYSGKFSAIYLLGQVVYSPIPSDPEVGIYFIAAVATRPQIVITPLDVMQISVGISL